MPASAFHALSASSFQPTNKTSIESIKKLRAASTSNESGLVGVERAGSPGQAATKDQNASTIMEQGVKEERRVEERQTSNETHIEE